MIKFWLDQRTYFCQDPVVEKCYYTPPFNKISTDGMIDLSFGMWFDGMYKSKDVKINIYVLNKGFKI